MKLKPCTILDIGELTDIVDNFHEESMHMHIREQVKILNPNAIWFLEGDSCIVFELLSREKYQVHIYSVSRDRRGRKLRDFAIRSSTWMIENTGATTFLNFVDKDRRDIQFFMKMIGARKVCTVPGVEQILYVSTRGMGIKEDI